MIWGDLINPVRKLHLLFVQEFSMDPTLYTRDIELNGIPVPFPDFIDDFDEWDETRLPADLQDLLPLHPVERALIEGPLLPIQIIKLKNAQEIDSLFAAILSLERAWMIKSATFSEDKMKFAETFFAAEGLKLSNRAGFKRIQALKETKS